MTKRSLWYMWWMQALGHPVDMQWICSGYAVDMQCTCSAYAVHMQWMGHAAGVYRLLCMTVCMYMR